MTERQMLEYLKTRVKNKAQSEEDSEEKERKRQNKIKWATFWRRNINLYISAKLGISTYSFQHISYYLMQEATMYEEIATRGTSKSFKMATYGIAECMLRPYSKVVITASTFQQASSLVEEKMERELFAKEAMSPVLYYLFKEGLIKINRKDQQIEVEFPFNHSIMYVVPCQESARRLRATILMFEECRLMTKGKIDSIFENMLQPRTAQYLNRPEYNGKEEYMEEVKSIYITSNRTKNEWFFRLFQKLFVGYFNDVENKNRIFACDIFTALKYGLKSKKWFLSKRRTMNELDFRMEVLNETLGEAEDAYFNLEMFEKNQIIKHAFFPPKPQDWKIKPHNGRKKQANEYRLLWIDFAFSNTNSKGRANDNTVIGCLAFYPKGDSWVRKVEYLETHEGGESFTSQRRIRELFWFYEADYIVLDLRKVQPYSDIRATNTLNCWKTLRAL